MSLPRRVLFGQTHMISRRCLQRRLLLKPSKTVNAIVRYALAVAQSRHGVELHAWTVEANHYHLLLTDPEGKLPAFQRDLDQLIARALNAHYGRGEAFWCPGSYSNVELHTAHDVLEKLVYVTTNTVKDGLVARPEKWPGLCSSPEEIGGPRAVVERPTQAFFGGRLRDDWEPTYRKGRRLVRGKGRKVEMSRRALKQRIRRREQSTMPAKATLQLTVPPAFAHMKLAEFRQLAREAVEEGIRGIHAERKAKGLTHFMGAQAVRNQDPFHSAGDTFPTFERNPRIACRGNKELRIQLLLGLKIWRAEYRAAQESWASGRRRKLFPHGTYWFRVFHRAKTKPELTAAG